MNSIVAIIISGLVYPGLIFALVAAIIFGWIRATSRALAQGAASAAPRLSFRAISRRWQQTSTTPEGVPPIIIQVLPVLAVVCPVLVLMFLPLPANRGLGTATYTGDLVAIGALLLGMPIVRIVLGWTIPSPYTRLAAMRSARQIMGYVLPLALALAVAAALGITTRIDAAAAREVVVNGKGESFANIARVIAGLAYAACLPVLARITPLRSGRDAIELAGSELTELSGRELLLMSIAEWVQFVAAIGLGVALFVLPFFRGDGPRAIAALVGSIVIAAALGIWEGAITPRIRPREDLTPPVAVWFNTPTFLGIVAVLVVVFAQRIG